MLRAECRTYVVAHEWRSCGTPTSAKNENRLVERSDVAVDLVPTRGRAAFPEWASRHSQVCSAGLLPMGTGAYPVTVGVIADPIPQPVSLATFPRIGGDS